MDGSHWNIINKHGIKKEFQVVNGLEIWRIKQKATLWFLTQCWSMQVIPNSFKVNCKHEQLSETEVSLWHELQKQTSLELIKLSIQAIEKKVDDKFGIIWKLWASIGTHLSEPERKIIEDHMGQKLGKIGADSINVKMKKLIFLMSADKKQWCCKRGINGFKDFNGNCTLNQSPQSLGSSRKSSSAPSTSRSSRKSEPSRKLGSSRKSSSGLPTPSSPQSGSSQKSSSGSPTLS